MENGSKWVKGLLDTFRHVVGQMPQEFKEHPVETFRRHVFVAPFYEEPLAELAEMIGVSQILFGSDYPHPEGLAEPVDFVHELEGFDPADVERVMSTNLKRLIEGAPTH